MVVSGQLLEVMTTIVGWVDHVTPAHVPPGHRVLVLCLDPGKSVTTEHWWCLTAKGPVSFATRVLKACTEKK